MIPDAQIEARLGRTLTADEIALIKRMNGHGASEDQIVEVMLMPAEEKEARLAVGYEATGRSGVQEIPLVGPVENG